MAVGARCSARPNKVGCGKGSVLVGGGDGRAIVYGAAARWVYFCRWKSCLVGDSSCEANVGGEALKLAKVHACAAMSPCVCLCRWVARAPESQLPPSLSAGFQGPRESVLEHATPRTVPAHDKPRPLSSHVS